MRVKNYNGKDVRFELCTALLWLTSLAGFAQDNEKIIIGGKVFNRAQIHVYPNSIPEFTVHFPNTEKEVAKIETIGTLRDENFIVTTWLQIEEDGLHYALIHHKIPPKIEIEIKNSKKRTREFLKTTAIQSLSAYGAMDIRFRRYNDKEYTGFNLTCRSDFSESLLVKGRICKIDNDLFFIVAADKESDINSLNQFIDSFRLY